MKRIVLTGFMGVGKSTVAKCLSIILKTEKIDLDDFIEDSENRLIANILQTEGEQHFREIETNALHKVLTETEIKIISLGGGTWTLERNRELIRSKDCTVVWLESTFEHCWRNIVTSKYKQRPLAKNRLTAEKLFAERQKVYCLSDWHFVVKAELTSFAIAKQIAEEIF
jgi:shikimate kinase